eukprot:CAMPEP_0181494260 /NCGR_PEP_ID=MMETSP1110-20121109/51670_1 /TAXON_ID=174948 /ORGANISM="Symbiodinium sp., Strain CCMP421" /LENGTH=81 /DNA_ID=CAMNT_0023621647 /DNA_START=27 /DNA_END=269 /DNA_ORIENTATION=-
MPQNKNPSAELRGKRRESPIEARFQLVGLGKYLSKWNTPHLQLGYDLDTFDPFGAGASRALQESLRTRCSAFLHKVRSDFC